MPPNHSGQHSHPGQWAPWPIHDLWIVNLRRRDSLTQLQWCYKSHPWISHCCRMTSILASWHLFSHPIHLPLALLALNWIQQRNIPNCSLRSHDSCAVGWGCSEPPLLRCFRHMAELWARLLYHQATTQEKEDRSRLSTSPDLAVRVMGEEAGWAVCSSLGALETLMVIGNLSCRAQF